MYLISFPVVVDEAAIISEFEIKYLNIKIVCRNDEKNPQKQKQKQEKRNELPQGWRTSLFLATQNKNVCDKLEICNWAII